MQSFRHELEDLNNPIVEKDIIDLEKKISLFNEGKMDEEKFRSLRLARGVYGQRQQGVQMIRIKLPYGKMKVNQLRRIAEVCDEYSNGNLHCTTRQDIQIHYVSLDRTPQLWAELEKDDVTLREACGNTVRNVTASYTAGVDPKELFDVTPYAHAFFEYFLRNPICQEMGRKFKVAFSSSDDDTGLTFMHDLGFIPRVKEVDGKQVKGFKVMFGGGLGAQPILAHIVHEFLPVDQMIPFSEGVIRVFDRHGERAKRLKARMKYLVKDIGVEEYMKLVEEERKALPFHSFPIDGTAEEVEIPALADVPAHEIEDKTKFEAWKKTNVFEQKQEGYFGIKLKIQLGNFSTDTARSLADLVEKFAGNDIRVTPNQGLMLKYVREEHLGYVFTELEKLNFAEPGFDSLADITTCPGTDTCNLGISSSYGIAVELERVMKDEFPDLIYENNMMIKISGCMNACGQHSIASIGFHGSSMKVGTAVAPALQVLIGGAVLGNGEGAVAEKVIKVPSRKGPDVLRSLLNDYWDNGNEGENYHTYYNRQGKIYFYELLKPLADIENLQPNDFIDWGHKDTFKPEIGVGECAGVVVDLIATMIYETEEKLDNAKQSFEAKSYSDSIYFSYNTLVNGAKALLLAHGHKTNTQAGIIKDFHTHFVETGDFEFNGKTFAEIVYQLKENEPTEEFAKNYLLDATNFSAKVKQARENQLSHAK